MAWGSPPLLDRRLFSWSFVGAEERVLERANGNGTRPRIYAARLDRCRAGLPRLASVYGLRSARSRMSVV